MEDPDATRRLWDLGVPGVERNGKNSSLVLGRALGTPSSGPPVCPALGTRGQQGVPPKHPQLPGGAAQLGTGDKEGTAEGAGPAELWGVGDSPGLLREWQFPAQLPWHGVEQWGQQGRGASMEFAAGSGLRALPVPPRPSAAQGASLEVAPLPLLT